MKKNKKKATREIKCYDELDTSEMIDQSKAIKYEKLGLKLPDVPPTQVISIRLPSRLLNEIKAIGSQEDVPYQALIKLMISESVVKLRKKAA